MYSIYFNNRCLAVCSKFEQTIQDPNAVILFPGGNQDLLTANGLSLPTEISILSYSKLLAGHPLLSDIPLFFQNSPQLSKLYLPTSDEDDTFSKLCAKLTPIQAGGGLVTNNKNEYLLIFRHGVWDLPKGKQEKDEDIREASIREVEEECGVHDLEIKSHICDTYHTYQLDEKFMIKCTHWYKMEYHGNGFDTYPQKEENIERAIWVAPKDLPKYLAETYPSIKEVFRIALQ